MLAGLYEAKADQLRRNPPGDGVSDWRGELRTAYAAAHTEQEIAAKRSGDPKEKSALDRLQAKLLESQGKNDEAAQLLSNRPEASNEGGDLIFIHGKCLAATGQTARGLQLLEKALRAGSLDDRRLLSEARVAHAEQQYLLGLVLVDYVVSRARNQTYQAWTTWLLENNTPALVNAPYGGKEWRESLESGNVPRPHLEFVNVPMTRCMKWYWPTLDGKRAADLDNALHYWAMANDVAPTFMVFERTVASARALAESGKFGDALGGFQTAANGLTPSTMHRHH